MKNQLIVLAVLLVAAGCGTSSMDSSEITETPSPVVVTDTIIDVQSDWYTAEIQDEVGNLTGEKLQRYNYKGTFSNSATTDSELCGVVSYEDDNRYWFTMKTYCMSMEAVTYRGGSGSVKVSIDSGPTETHTVHCQANGWYRCSSRLSKRIEEAEEKVVLALREANFRDYGNATYRFDFPANRQDTVITYKMSDGSIRTQDELEAN